MPDNQKIKDSILGTITEMNSQQTVAITEVLMQALDRSSGKLNDILTEIYTDLKKTENVQMKLKLAVPLINLLGINLETEFDVKSRAKKLYEKHKTKIFELMCCNPPHLLK